MDPLSSNLCCSRVNYKYKKDIGITMQKVSLILRACKIISNLFFELLGLPHAFMKVIFVDIQLILIL